MKKRTSWYWAVPFVAGLALIMVAALLSSSSPGSPGVPGVQAAEPTVTPTPNACTGMSISKDANVDEVPEGGSITYTITVEFSGDPDCLDLQISDAIPDNVDCADASVLSDESDVDVRDPEGCNANGTVTWDIRNSDAADANDGDVAVVEMVVDLESGTSDGDQVDNEACILSGSEVEDCDGITVDVGEPATATPQPTATRQATVQPIPTIQPPPAIAPTIAPPAIAPPATGTGSDGDSSRPLAMGLGLVGICLLLVSGAALVKRTR